MEICLSKTHLGITIFSLNLPQSELPIKYEGTVAVEFHLCLVICGIVTDITTTAL